MYRMFSGAMRRLLLPSLLSAFFNSFNKCAVHTAQLAHYIQPRQSSPFHIKGAGEIRRNRITNFHREAETSIKDLTFKVHRYDFIELIFWGRGDDIYFAVVNLKGHKRRKIEREDRGKPSPGSVGLSGQDSHLRGRKTGFCLYLQPQSGLQPGKMC